MSAPLQHDDAPSIDGATPSSFRPQMKALRWLPELWVVFSCPAICGLRLKPTIPGVQCPCQCPSRQPRIGLAAIYSSSDRPATDSSVKLSAAFCARLDLIPAIRGSPSIDRQRSASHARRCGSFWNCQMSGDLGSRAFGGLAWFHAPASPPAIRPRRPTRKLYGRRALTAADGNRGFVPGRGGLTIDAMAPPTTAPIPAFARHVTKGC